MSPVSTVNAASATAHLALLHAHESAAEVLRRRNPAAAARHEAAGRALRFRLGQAA